MKRFVFTSIFLSGMLLVSGAWTNLVADSADVLPKGVSRVSLKGNFYTPVDEKFDEDGNRESIAKNFNTVLDETVLPGVIPTGTNIGTSIADLEHQFQEVEISYQYGLTDKLTLGIFIPYWWNKTKVNEARVDTSNATAPVLAGLGITTPPGDPATDAAVTQLMLSTLTQAPFDYEPFQTWSDSGLADIEAGVRYQYHNSEKWATALNGGIRFPTGAVVDPDNLIDVGFGDGAYALLFRVNQDYKGIEKLLLNATLKYDMILPSKQKVRVPNSVDQFLVPDVYREKIDKDTGDVLKLELSGSYSLSDTFGIGLVYEYGRKQKDKVDGDLGLAYSSLETETDWTSQLYIISLSYSTVPLYVEKKVSIPFDISMAYRDRFAGSNNSLDSEYLSISFNLYF